MTAPHKFSPDTSDLIKMLDLHVDGVRHYLHLQIGKPLSKELISAPEIALDNLHREVTAALRATATEVGCLGNNAPCDHFRGTGNLCLECAHAATPTNREQIAKVFSYIWHGDVGEWKGFLSKADAFLAYPWPDPAQSRQDRDETLRGLAEFFSESVHLVWSNEEIADCLIRMISKSSALPSTLTIEELSGWVEHGLCYGVSSPAARTVARQLLERFDISAKASPLSSTDQGGAA